jgi:DNA-damage-inducible protein J
MAKTVSIQIPINADLKKQATELFEELGLDMSSAINLFLHQCVLHGGLPFAVEVPRFNKQMLEAIEEAKRLAFDQNAKSYNSLKELKEALESD